MSHFEENLNSKKIKSPTRVDLAGGTLDMWPLYTFVGGAKTINLALDIWTKVEVIRKNDKTITIKSLDLNKEWNFSSFALFLKTLDPQISLFQKIFEPFSKKNEFDILSKGFELITSSESPIGGGLGGSSSLVISILKAIYFLLNQPCPPAVEMVNLAHHIEAEVLRTPTGTQDYFPAVTGGLSCIDYSQFGITNDVYSIEGTPFQDHVLLVYTGKSHHSGLNNFEVLKSAVEGQVRVLDALKSIKEISEKMLQTIIKKDWQQMPYLFQQEYQARLQLTPAFSSPEIEKLSEICLKAGAHAVKICGAGGGGCVMVWVPPQNREKVVQVCQNEKFQCLNAQPVNPLK